MLRYDAYEIHSNSNVQSLKALGKAFEDIYASLDNLGEVLRSVETAQKATLKRYQNQLKTFDQLGTHFNGFSLEHSDFSTDLEAIGESYDGYASSLADTVVAQHKICDQLGEMHLYIGATKRPMKSLIGRAVEYEFLTTRLNLLKSSALQNMPLDNTKEENLAKLEQEEHRISQEIAEAKKMLLLQLQIWIRRLGCNWQALLLQISSARKSFAEQGISNDTTLSP